MKKVLEEKKKGKKKTERKIKKKKIYKTSKNKRFKTSLILIFLWKSLYFAVSFFF